MNPATTPSSPVRPSTLGSALATPVTVTKKLAKALASHGWTAAGADEQFAYFEGAGFWLRLRAATSEAGWSASLSMERHSVPQQGVATRWYREDELATVLTNPGARAKASITADLLCQEHRQYLAPLGVTLTDVSVRHQVGRGKLATVESARFIFPAAQLSLH